MRVFDIDKKNELSEYDLTKGYLTEDTLTTEIPEREAVKEQYHYEVIAQYANGGKSVKKVIDVEGVEYAPARTETERVYVYTPYTEAELAKITAEREIAELKQMLNATDYKAIKYAEGLLTEEEYAETKAERQKWRERINELEQV